MEPYSWVGLGWSLHIGRLHNANFISNETPIIEFPDGHWETAYPSLDFADSYITREFLKLTQDGTNYYLYFKDGTVWTFGTTRTITYYTGNEQVRLVTKIEDSYGHHIDITYKTSLPVIEKITDSLGRVVNFISEGTTNPKLTRIDVKNANGGTVSYYYSVGTFPNIGYYKLLSYDPPELPASTFEYNSSLYELTKINTCYGGTMEYTYGDHNFYYYNTSYVSRVVTQKNIKFNASETANIWTYSYPSYANGADGTVTVQGPQYTTTVVYSGMGSDIYNNGWKIGLIKQKTFSDGSYSETYTWTPKQISDSLWIVTSLNLGPIKAPLIASITRTPIGDCSSKDVYTYASELIKYGLPSRIDYYGNSNLRYYKLLNYYFQQNSVFAGKYMVSFLSTEQIYSSSGSLQKQSNFSYYTSQGTCGALDWIKRKKSSSTELIWDYTYSENTSTKTIIITINPPGNNSGTETYTYKYGVLAKKEKPGYVEFNRTISQYDSSIMSETNQHGATYYFSYDNLGRITSVDLPSAFNDIEASWSTNSVNIAQGNHMVVKYWDGMGRDLGYQEQGDGLTLYYRKTLDAEGRAIKESKGAIAASDEYVYSYNAAGRITQIKDPLNNVTTYTYAGTKTTIKDPLNRQTEITFTYLPGLISTLKDPSGASANYSYDSVGRLLSVVYNSGRTQNYSYDFLDNVVSETHPETGQITYTYNSENLLSQKSFGGVPISYEYNSSNQLKKISTSDETINYEYDSNGRISRIYSNKGWERNNIAYNSFGSVTGEVQVISGLSSKTLQYEYDANNILKKVIYPDGKSAVYTNNGLNMPETAAFNGLNLVSQISYGVSKQPTAISISGNGTEHNATYNSIGQLITASLIKAGLYLYKATYSYDPVGNILGISDTIPNLNVNFTYDELYRIKTATYTPAGVGRVDSFAYNYDQYGNLTQVKENGNQVFIKSYNSKNQPSDFTFDSRGNLVSGSGYQYQWDNLNRLSSLNYGGEIKGKYFYNERGLRIKALPAMAEMNIKVGTNNIPDGGQIEFRSAPGSYVDKTFTIENLGDAILILSGSPIVIITGVDANQFSVVQQPTASIAPGGTSNFIVRFSPASAGTKNAAISIANNDLDENPYDLNLVGTNPVAEINLKLEGADLPSGQTVEFTAPINGSVDKTFTIENLGEAQLLLNGTPAVAISGTDASQFSVIQQPASPINPGSSSSFVVRFSPTTSGNKNAMLSIANNDSDENPYELILSGIVSVGGPEIDIPQAQNGGNYNFGTVKGPAWVTFTINNLGSAPLLLSGNPLVELSGENADEFYIVQPSTSSIQPGANTTFIIRLYPATSGPKMAEISISNNDSDENPYVVNLVAFVILKEDPPPNIIVTDPDGSNDIGANSITSVKWEGGLGVQNLNIEYSLDNGTTYRQISDRYLNTGEYKWRVPPVVTPSALVRISSAEGQPFEPQMMSFEASFKINKLDQSKDSYPGGQFKMNISIPDQKTNGMWSASLAFQQNINGDQVIKCNYLEGKTQTSNQSVNRWHHLKVLFDRATNSADVFFNGEEIIKDVPMELKFPAKACPEIVVSTVPGCQSEVLVDDLVVKVWHPIFNLGREDTVEPVFLPVWKERFENYLSDEELAYGGWLMRRLDEGKEESVSLLNVMESASGLKSLRLSSGLGASYSFSKSLAMPDRYPFDVSDESFGIRAKKVGRAEKEEETERILKLRTRRFMKGENGVAGGSSINKPVQNQVSSSNIEISKAGGTTVIINTGASILSVGSTGTYYVYSFDGKLLSEYNGLGGCQRDYIYLRDRLLAEYQPESGQIYYYASDQVNSTRVVTDQNWVRVFAATYDPYGGIQKTWENSC